MATVVAARPHGRLAACVKDGFAGTLGGRTRASVRSPLPQGCCSWLAGHRPPSKWLGSSYPPGKPLRAPAGTLREPELAFRREGAAKGGQLFGGDRQSAVNGRSAGRSTSQAVTTGPNSRRRPAKTVDANQPEQGGTDTVCASSRSEQVSGHVGAGRRGQPVDGQAPHAPRPMAMSECSLVQIATSPAGGQRPPRPVQPAPGRDAGAGCSAARGD